MKTYLVILAVVGITSAGLCQSRYDIGRRKVKLLPIDTLESFIYQTKQARIYFSQYDIEELIIGEAKQDSAFLRHHFLLDTLRQNTTQILVREDTVYKPLYHSMTAQYNGSQIPPRGDKRDYLSEAFMFLAADLMIEGKCLPYSKADKKFYTKSMIIKRQKGLMGSKYLTFLFPNKKRFYSIVTTFGE